MNLIEQEWRKVEARLRKNGIGRAQRQIMAQSFFSGAWQTADVVREALDRADSPEQFALLLAHVIEELKRIRERGCVVTSEGQMTSGE